MPLGAQHRQQHHQPHLFVGLSTHDHRVHTRHLMAIMGLISCGRFKVTLSNVSSGGIHKARNNLAYQFLCNTDAEWYLSVDSDISFDPDHVSRLISHDVDIVGGPYCHKKPELEWSARALEGKGVDPRTGLQEISAHGTGMLLIKRGVMEAQRRAAEASERWHVEDWNEDKGKKKWDIFWEGTILDPEFGYPQRTQLTEDFGFCYWARKLGYKIYVDTTFHVTHWEGGRGYPEKQPPTLDPAQVQGLSLNERISP